MRPIDADALIEKCGGWYVDECTESGFIGTLENLLATEPTIQPQSTTGQLNDGARSTAQSTDLIDRQAAIDAINHICPVDTEYDCTLLDRADVRCVLSDLPSVRPVATDTNVGDSSEMPNSSDCISRQQALDAVGKYASVWMEYTDAMSKDEIAQIALNNAKSTMIRILKELPTAQPEPSIPLSWIEKHIEWHKSLDSEFANLAAAHISVMVKKWRDEQDETD